LKTFHTGLSRGVNENEGIGEPSNQLQHLRAHEEKGSGISTAALLIVETTDSWTNCG